MFLSSDDHTALSLVLPRTLNIIRVPITSNFIFLVLIFTFKFTCIYSAYHLKTRWISETRNEIQENHPFITHCGSQATSCTPVSPQGSSQARTMAELELFTPIYLLFACSFPCPSHPEVTAVLNFVFVIFLVFFLTQFYHIYVYA